MKNINYFIIVILILSSIVVYGDVCSQQQPINTPCNDVVRLLSSCNYVDVYDDNNTFYTQFLLKYINGYYYYNYTIDLDKKGDFTLQFCDGQTYSFISMYDSSDPFYMRLNTTFLKDNDKLKISYFINITNDTILQSNLTLFEPNGDFYSSLNLVPENSINGSVIYNNTFLSSIQVGFWDIELNIIGVNYSYVSRDSFKVNSNNKTLSYCDITNINYTYEIPQYCDLNFNCYVFFNPNLNTTTNKKSIAYLISNNTQYNMFYSSDNYWYSIIKTNKSEDLSLSLFVFYDDNNNTICSQKQTGKIKFRKAYDVEVKLFIDGLFNSTKSYRSDYDYLYFIYTNDTKANPNAMLNNLNKANGFFGELNKMNKKVYKFGMGTKGGTQQFSTYFWNKYYNGKATIRLYETGIYDLYIVNSNSQLDSSFKQFNRPARDDVVTYDNKLYTGIYLNESATWNLKTNIFTIDWWGVVFKILITIFIITLFVGFHILIGLLPEPTGQQISGFVAIITIPLMILFIVITWWK